MSTFHGAQVRCLLSCGGSVLEGEEQLAGARVVVRSHDHIPCAQQLGLRDQSVPVELHDSFLLLVKGLHSLRGHLLDCCSAYHSGQLERKCLCSPVLHVCLPRGPRHERVHANLPRCMEVGMQVLDEAVPTEAKLTIVARHQVVAATDTGIEHHQTHDFLPVLPPCAR